MTYTLRIVAVRLAPRSITGYEGIPHFTGDTWLSPAAALGAHVRLTQRLVAQELRARSASRCCMTSTRPVPPVLSITHEA
ncbi:hypothetical protein VTK26DRAFT_5597 [Humicola hyalothermophila]